MPSTKRPPESRSSVAICLASVIGSCCATQRDAGAEADARGHAPRRRRARRTGSRLRLYSSASSASPVGGGVRRLTGMCVCSGTYSEWKPRASASRASSPDVHGEVGREDRDAELHAGRHAGSHSRLPLACVPSGLKHVSISAPHLRPGSRVRSGLRRDYQLEHRYTRARGRVYLTGVQALVRLPLLQRRARPRGGPAHRGLHLRLSRLAARHLRPGALAGARAARGAPRPLRARRERGPRRDGGLGLAAGEAARRARATTASSASGTARAPASIAPATR